MAFEQKMWLRIFITEVCSVDKKTVPAIRDPQTDCCSVDRGFWEIHHQQKHGILHHRKLQTSKDNLKNLVFFFLCGDLDTIVNVSVCYIDGSTVNLC